MKTIEIISQDLFDKIRSRFENLQMGDESGEVTMDPRKARFYDFDFTIESHNLGRVSISINELGTLKMFYGKSILEDIDPISKDYWYDFLREMRSFAMRRLLRFDTRDITKSNLNKDDFQYLATNGSKEENMNESQFKGGRMTSHRMLERTKLVIKHKKGVEEGQPRGMPSNIAAIFIENEEGERYKYPFIHTAGAKAMQRHVANGGRPYDELGRHIIDTSSKIAQLSAFHRHMGRHDQLNQEVHEIAGKTGAKLESLRQHINSLHGQRGYEAFAETFEPVANGYSEEIDDVTMEDYKNKFTVSSFREDLAQYFPLIHNIMQEAGTIDLEEYVNEGDICDDCEHDPCICDKDTVKENEFDIFRKWTESVAENGIEPDTLGELIELLGSGNLAQVGVDATSTIEALQGIGIEDDELQKDLEAIAKNSDGQANPQHTILAWLQKIDPQAAAELEQGAQQQPEPAPEAQPAQQPDPQQMAQQQMPVDPQQQQPMAEEEQDEDEMHGKEPKSKGKTVRELAHWLGAFYNKDFKDEGFKSPWRKGPTELGIMAEKEFGPHHAHLVKELMGMKGGETKLQRAARRSHERKKEMEGSESVFNNHNEPKRASATRPGQQPPGLRMAEAGEFDVILRLAGLKQK
jgi:hypothetical protein